MPRATLPTLSRQCMGALTFPANLYRKYAGNQACDILSLSKKIMDYIWTILDYNVQTLADVIAKAVHSPQLF